MTVPDVEIAHLLDGPDLDGILAIDALSFSRPWTRAMYENELRQPERSFILVARTATNPVSGYCACWVVADELQINNVAVLPAERRHGVGRALIRAALAKGQRRGATRAWLEVRSANLAARELYGTFGFAEVARRLGYYEYPPDDAIVMQAVIQSIGVNPAS